MDKPDEENTHPLFPVPAEDYNASASPYREHLFEQYKLFVDSAVRVTEWRNTASNYMLAVNTTLVTLYGLASTVLSGQFWKYIVALTGILLAIAWMVLIGTYKKLNSAKFKVIHELEKKMPAALFAHEWDYLKDKSYAKLTKVEMGIPAVFLILYLVLAGFALCKEPDSSALRIQLETPNSASSDSK